MKTLASELKEFVRGEVRDDSKTLKKFSKDASLIVLQPEVVVSPKDSQDIGEIVRFVAREKSKGRDISISPRAAGTCMSGGSLTESIVLDLMTHMGGVMEVNETKKEARVKVGTYYRDFEKATLKHNLLLPCYTASKEINAIGGMIGNNSGGEKTLKYGKTEDYILETKTIFSDGKEYVVKPLNKKELDAKMAQKDFEGRVYREVFSLVTKNSELLKKAKPKVSKNSSGYLLWNVWDGKIFDLNKLLVGAQGTLGVTTEVKFKLVSKKKFSKLLVIFMKDLEPLAEVVNAILPFGPESLESYDDHTAKLALRFLPDLVKIMKQNIFSLAWSFLPELGLIFKGGLPKIVLLAEVAGNSEKDVDQKLRDMKRAIRKFNLETRITYDQADTKKYWTVRRESFSLLRKHVHGKRTAPFIDDVIVDPELLPEFLPKLIEILDRSRVTYTIAGHAGNGNFHVIPLMDMHKGKNRNLIPELSERVYSLVLKYGGSITAEHGDGIIRTPYIEQMFGRDVVEIFKKTKEIFDPLYVLNPGKKVPLPEEGAMGTVEFAYEHLARE